MDIIRSLIYQFEITEGTERGKPDGILIGALAAILTLTQNNTAALISENGGRILLVGGQGLFKCLQFIEQSNHPIKVVPEARIKRARA